MGYSQSDRIYGKCKHIKGASRRIGKGRKKKVRRMMRAFAQDGWERKKANGLSPQFRPAKKGSVNEI